MALDGVGVVFSSPESRVPSPESRVPSPESRPACHGAPSAVSYTSWPASIDPPAAHFSSWPAPLPPAHGPPAPPFSAPRPATSSASPSSACGGRGGANLKRRRRREHRRALRREPERPRQGRRAVSRRRASQVDFRRVFDHPDEFDAVVVSTSEHTHAFATLPALQLKKHVYCEKPLTHNVQGGAASSARPPRKAGVATQMGTQIHAGDNYRRVVELIQSRRDRPGDASATSGWRARGAGTPARPRPPPPRTSCSCRTGPAPSTPCPPGLDWDLWLGPAPARPFNNVYLPGPKWYRWWDFGNGTMSDLGSHWIDLPFWALKLQCAVDHRGQRPAAASGDRARVDAGAGTHTRPRAISPR